MINLFDLSTGMAGTKKAFRDGSIGGRNQPIMLNKAIDHVEIHSQDKPATCESRKGSSGKKASTTPMKMLIAQKISKEMDTRWKPPNVIARLMGLDDAMPGDPSVASPICLREADKDMKLHISESLCRHRRDESLLSSVFLNGYVGDDSSFNRSENYVGEDCNNSDHKFQVLGIS